MMMMLVVVAYCTFYVADEFVSVACSFRNRFICGYESSEVGSWRWSWTTGKDNNPLTGPESDDTGDTFGMLLISTYSCYMWHVTKLRMASAAHDLICCCLGKNV